MSPMPYSGSAPMGPQPGDPGMSGPQSSPVGPGGAQPQSDPQTVAALALLTSLVDKMAQQSNQGAGGQDLSTAVDTNVQSPTGVPPPPQGPPSTAGAPIMPAAPPGAGGPMGPPPGMKSQRGLPPPKFSGMSVNSKSGGGPGIPSLESAGAARSLLGKPPQGVAALSKPQKPVSVPKPKGQLPN